MKALAIGIARVTAQAIDDGLDDGRAGDKEVI
jgi:hypothetical protein